MTAPAPSPGREAPPPQRTGSPARRFPVPLLRLAALFRRYRKLAFLGLGMLVLFAIAVWGYERASHITENDARVKADMIVVSSRVDGWIAERLVTDGEPVRRDQVLAVIDQREASLKLDELRAKAETVRLQQERTGVLLRMTDATAQDALAAAQSRRRAAVAQLEQSRREFERADGLRDRVVSRETWEQRQNQLRQAEENERTATAVLSDAKAKLASVDVLRKELEGLTHDAALIDAQIREREIDVADRQVRSQIDGVVDEKFVQPGEYVAPGQRLFLIHDPRRVWVDADIKETKLSALRPGQHVDVSVDAYPDRRFSGRIERIGSAASSEFALLPSPNPSGNFTKIAQRVPVRIAVEQPEGNPLRPGMMVEIDIDTAQP